MSTASLSWLKIPIACTHRLASWQALAPAWKPLKSVALLKKKYSKTNYREPSPTGICQNYLGLNQTCIKKIETYSKQPRTNFMIMPRGLIRHEPSKVAPFDQGSPRMPWDMTTLTRWSSNSWRGQFESTDRQCTFDLMEKYNLSGATVTTTVWTRRKIGCLKEWPFWEELNVWRRRCRQVQTVRHLVLCHMHAACDCLHYHIVTFG